MEKRSPSIYRDVHGIVYENLLATLQNKSSLGEGREVLPAQIHTKTHRTRLPYKPIPRSSGHGFLQILEKFQKGPIRLKASCSSVNFRFRTGTFQ